MLMSWRWLKVCSEIAVICTLATVCLAHPDFVEQIADVTKQMSERGESVELLRQRADLFRRHAEFDAALVDLAAAEKLQTNLPSLHLDRARVLGDAGRSQAALAEIQIFLARQPEHGEALLIAARSQARLGQKESAVQTYTKAIQRSAEPTPDMFLERARLLAEVGKLEEAVSGLDEAIAQNSFASPLQMTAIEYDRQRGAFDSALARVDGLIAHYPVKEPWLVLRAEVLEQAGRTNEAKETFERVISGLETYPEVRRSLALTKKLKQRARHGLTRVVAVKTKTELLSKP